MTPYVVLILSCITFLPYGSALQVTPGSTCAAFCLDNPESDPLSPGSSNTATSDITCTDDSFDNSATGIKFKNCVDCLQKSNATSIAAVSLTIKLDNVRYSVDVCLFGFPDDSKSISSPCNINWACQPLKTALEAGDLDDTGDQLGYCAADGNFTTAHHIDDCVKCLASSPSQEHLANFMTALKAGCEQKPAPGELIGLSGSLFAGELVNITTPPAQVPTDNNGGGSGFGVTSTGAIVGISIGGALLLLGGIALFWIYHRRQKRMFGRISSPDNDSRAGNISTAPFAGGFGGFSSTEKGPTSQMSDYELHAQMNYTSNAEYYKALERGMQMNRANYAADPSITRSGPRTILPTHPAYLPRTHSRQGSQEVAPKPPRPAKTNKPDSYAIQAYLSAAEDTGAFDLLPPPPPGPPPAAAFRGPSPNQYPQHSRDSSLDARGPSPDRRPLLQVAVKSTGGTPNLPPPPPPSTRQSKVPSLAFPSVSRIRVPKKYTPPKISVQAATPVDEGSASASFSEFQQQAGISIGQEVNPMVSSEPHSDGIRRKQHPPPLNF
ncbi:hypothetical protein FHL15_011080 [Xylaria flabelliformis]|uniref:Exo-alpha-sialidase / neuraminidase n=1 Tax=Xylaria flabelliformis TaxID=2512241 RepID=A0A553HJ99_9PEZI|nr:hypothetical protein FHL15_011080 [Xylaria flabelliformis]